MPRLVSSLKIQDEGFLRIVAELWEVDLSIVKDAELVPFLAQSIITNLSNPEVFNNLPNEARSALNDLIRDQGAMPWSVFERQHGMIRDMGAGKRDREKPYLAPISPAEYLWYRGVLFRAFQETLQGVEEFAYIPQDILSVFPQMNQTQTIPHGRPALPEECQVQYIANDLILDHTCTLLAALRLEYDQKQLATIAAEWLDISPDSPLSQAQCSPSITGLIRLLYSAELLGEKEVPKPDLTRAFLESGRGEALRQLYLSWSLSTQFNELRMLPSLVFEGNWQNDAQKARQAILAFLSEVPSKTWWNVASFIDAIKQQKPDFQRRAGEYDSWYIRASSTNASLRGFDHWDDIEGALIHFILCAPLHWLGVVDLASATEASPILAVRITSWGEAFFKNLTPTGFKEEIQSVYAYADGRIRVPLYTPRPVRYQISRFCRWEQKKAEEYLYRITPESLEQAARQGLRVDQLIVLLQRHTSTVPPSLIKALSRWETNGCEARLEEVMVLRVRDPQLISKLKKSNVARFLGDILGSSSIIVKPGGWEKIQGFLSEQGYLSKS